MAKIELGELVREVAMLKSDVARLSDGWKAKDAEIERIRAELEVSESVNRTKTELLVDLQFLLSDAECTPGQQVMNALTAIKVRTGPPRCTKPTQDLQTWLLRGGPGRDYPCNEPSVFECAHSECQEQRRCHKTNVDVQQQAGQPK